MVYYSLAHPCCSRAICRKASRVYCEDWQVYSGATCFCWRVLRRSPNYIQRSCMVYSWNQSSAESLFCAWTTVCLMFWKVNINVLISSLTRFSVLPALSLHNGIIHCDIVEGSFCTETFYSFIGGVLDNMNPYPEPNSVIVMDNCRIHKHPEILDLIHARYVCILFSSLTVFDICDTEEWSTIFFHHTPLISIPSSLRFRPWNITFVAMVRIIEWQWQKCPIKTSI